MSETPEEKAAWEEWFSEQYDLTAAIRLAVAARTREKPPGFVAALLAGALESMAEDIRSYVDMSTTIAKVAADEAHLGLATTRALLEEVDARMRISQNSTAGRELGDRCREAISNLGAGVLDYRTVDSDS